MQTGLKNSNAGADKSREEIKRLMQEVLSLAKAEGASDASVAVNQDQGYSVNVRMRELETLTFNDEKSINVTVYFGQRHGSASSTDTDTKALASMVSAAANIAKLSAEDPCFGLADKELVQKDYADLDLYQPWELSPEEAIERALRCEAYALEQDPRIVNSDGVNLSTYAFYFGFANSQGCEALGKSTRHSLSCSLIAKEGETMQRDYEYSTCRYASELMDDKQLAKIAVQRSLDRLGARKIKTQKAPVIFDARVSGGLFSAFINGISGSNLYRKNSFLLDSLGQPIFPDWLEVYEQPYLQRGLGSASFDAEGVPTRNNHFVEQGRVKQYVLGSYSARKLGLKTTANSGGVHNLTVDPSHPDLKSLLKLMGRGFLVTELMGQGVNILTGDYSRGASGFWVENGEIQYPVEELTIAGNLKTVFASIAAVAADRNPSSSTRCGSVLVPEMMLGGQ